jgi:ribose-phosphate pyrophosphokinase
MSNTLPPIKVFAGEASRYLGESICKELGIELGKMNKERFADGEFEVGFEESIRGAEVYLVQSTFPTSENLMELLLMIDAAKRASAAHIIAVVPYFGWARQDRKDKPRVSIAAKLVADLLSTAGISRLITMDLHADQIQGFFNVPVDHLYASSIFIPYIESLHLKEMVIASPDVGGAKRANSYAKYFDVPLVLCHKTRAKANVVEKMTVIGDVTDKNVVLVDDIIDTAGTMTKAADLLLANGAKSVRALCSHPVMSNPATERVLESGLEEIIFTDSIPYNKENNKATVLPVAKLFADTIRRIHNNQSISSQYLFK